MKNDPQGKIAKAEHPGPLAISIKPIWAWAIVYANKIIENRSWATKYRGVLYIHASAQQTNAEYLAARNWMLSQRLVTPSRFPRADQLAKGVFVGQTKIVECRKTPRKLLPWEMPGDYSWLLAPTVPVPPIICRGVQKLWEIPEGVLEELGER